MEIEHIQDWSRVREHVFENMIVLCANCHGRKGARRGQIDRKSLRQHKAALAVLNSRYSDLERRVLEIFAIQREHMPAAPDPDGFARQVPATLRLMMYLLKDRYVELASMGMSQLTTLDGQMVVMVVMVVMVRTIPNIDGPPHDIDSYRLAGAGAAFVDAGSMRIRSTPHPPDAATHRVFEKDGHLADLRGGDRRVVQAATTQ